MTEEKIQEEEIIEEENPKEEETKETTIEGIILDVDYGFGMKFKDEEGLYLKLYIQQFDGYDCIQLYREESIAKLLLQYKGDYRGEISCNTLTHRRVFLLTSDTTNGVPNAIAKYPPSKYPQYSWIYNHNWD